jgi:Ca-activated chloride channel homolog
VDEPDAIRLTLETPAGDATELLPRRIVRGRYEAAFPAVDMGEYRMEATIDGSGGPTATIGTSMFIDYPDELRLQPENVALLQAVATTTGGRFDPSAESLLTPDGRTRPRRYSPWRPLLLASLLLILADLAIRRWRL